LKIENENFNENFKLCGLIELTGRPPGTPLDYAYYDWHDMCRSAALLGRQCQYFGGV